MLRKLLVTSNDWILAMQRLVMGGIFFAHGAQKALGWFGGYGFSGTMGFFTQQMHVYAHCLRNQPGVALLVVNADQQQDHEIALPSDAERYTLTANQLQDKAVQLNGKMLELNSDGDVPEFVGQPTRSGRISFMRASITFLAVPNANNRSCP